MKNKKTTLAVLVASVFFFSGCSLTPAQNAPSAAVQKYTVSNSFWRSDDGGKTWQAKNQSANVPTTKDLDVVNVEVNPYDGKNVLLGLRAGGIVETLDAGDSLSFTQFKTDKTYGLAIS